ncbi:alginate O-acetyltransferase AlgX-related protein [Dyella silvatica]|uniref:alginate O-acetyltransferase AlgX-related protein n=1 Tax=Dyella silvatica TaxID=2992128 RepID=UPI002253F34C|nr:tetratricopeptide repeat protein [Dyella silvatica]
MNQPAAIPSSELKGRAVVVARGTSSRLFCEYQDSPVISTIAKNDLISTKAAVKWKRMLETRARLLKLRGLHLYMLIAPEARYIFREEIPSHMVLSDRSPARQFTELFSGIDNLTIIYPDEALIAARGGIDIYRANDTHWSAYGAFIAYQALIEHFPADTPLNPVTAADVSYRFRQAFGDMGALVEPEVSADMPVASIRDGTTKLVLNYSGDGRNAWKRFESTRGRGHAFVLRDSFATELGIFMNESFARVDWLGGTSRLHLEAIDEEKPDIVVWEVAERRLLVEDSDHSPSTAYEIYAFDNTTPYGMTALEACDDKVAGHLAKALQGARDAAKHPDAGTPYLYLLADILRASSLFDEAEATIQRAIKIREDRPAYWHLLSVISRHLGKPREATDASFHAKKLAPHNGQFVSDCGYNLLTLGRRDEAIEVMASCRALVSDSPHLSYWLALAYFQAGDIHQARKEAINAYLLWPDHPDIYALLWMIEDDTR